MPSSPFESAYIHVRAAIGDDAWKDLSDLRHADLICCEMYRLAEIQHDNESAAGAPQPKHKPVG